MAIRSKKTKTSRKSNSKKRPAKRRAQVKLPAKRKKAQKPKSKVRSKKSNKKAVGTCFVLMPFKEPFDTYYPIIIKPAIAAAGLDPLRGDSLFRPSPIMADVWSMIQKAKVLVAELTEKNANVFYELGLGHAIGKPIILMSETIDDVPFDLQPLRVILYDKDVPDWGAKLRTALIAALDETLSDPLNAVPSMFRKVVKSQAPEESKTGARLSALERQLTSLEFPDRFAGMGKPSFRSVNDFREQLEFATSPEQAADITRMALRSGIPRSIIRKELSRLLGGREGERVFALATQSRTTL